MEEKRKRQPSKWDNEAKQTQKRITPRAKEAILREYEMRMAKEESRDVILDNLAEKLDKSERQIERYIHDATEAREKAIEEKALSLVERLKTRIGRKETVHHRVLRKLAHRLAGELILPISRDIFSVSLDNKYWFADKASWTVPQRGGVQVFLPIEQPGETQVLYHCLLEHLSSSAFSGIPEGVGEWRQMVAQYLPACYRLLDAITGEVEAVLGVKVAGDHIEKPGIMTAFPLTICFDSVERAKGTSLTSGFEYRVETTPRRLSQLKFGAYGIAVAGSARECNHYQAEHYDLRNKWARSKRAKDIAALSSRVGELEAQLRDELQRFRLSNPVPGQCRLCSPHPS